MAEGAAASDFGYSRAARRERLLSDLVVEVLGQQPGEMAHDRALATCLRDVKHHRFADTEPKQIERLYADLGERMESLAQFRKQRALAALSGELLAAGLPGDTPEAAHRLLSLLYHAAGRPLSTPYHPAPAQPPQPGDQPAEAGEASAAASPAASEPEAASDGGSELSEWSDSEAGGNAWVDEVVEEPPEPVAPEPEPEPLWLPQPRSTYARPPQPQLGGGVAPDAAPGCLFQQLAAARCAEVPFAVPLPAARTSQPRLAAQVVSMLRGSAAPGPAFAWREAAQRFDVAPGLHVPDLSPLALHALLARFAAAGATAVRLWRAVGELHAGGSNAAPTWTAFLTVLRAQLQELAPALAAAEVSAGRGLARGNLLQLRAELQAPMRQLRLLAETLRAAEATQPACSPAERSARLLSALQRLLSRASQLSGARGREAAACLLRLLTAALAPCLAATDAWLRGGALPQAHEEFFVQLAPAGEQQGAWAEAFRLRTGEGDAPACADFLAPAASAALEAGRALLLLRSHCAADEGAAREAADAAVAASNVGEPLCRSFLSGLQAELQGEVQQAAAGLRQDDAEQGCRPSACFEAPTAPIAERMAAAGCSAPPPEQPALPPLTPAKQAQRPPEPPLAPAAAVQYRGEGEAWAGAPLTRARLDALAGTMGCPGDRRQAAVCGGGALDLSPLSAEPRPAAGWQLSPITNEAGAGAQAWLGSVRGAELPPVQVLLQRCLLAPIHARAEASSGSLLAASGGLPLLRAQLAELRGLFLGATPALLPLAHALVPPLLAGQQLPALPLGELQAALEEGLVAGQQDGPLPAPADVTLCVSGEEHAKICAGLRAAREKRGLVAPGNGGGSGGSSPLPRTLVEAQALRLEVAAGWPLALLLDADARRLYNSIAAFLLQLKWAREAVCAAPAAAGRQPPAPAIAARQQLLHLVSSLEHFVTHAHAAAWQRLKQELAAAGGLAQARAAHRAFLEAAARPCMGSGDASWLLIHSVLRQLLDLCLRFHELPAQGAEARLAQLRSDFRDRHRYLLKSLTARSLKAGDASGLQHLASLLDFNRHYHFQRGA